MKHVYLLCFEPEATERFNSALKEFTKTPQFHDWWHHISSAVVVVTDMSARAVSNHFVAIATKHETNGRHLLVSIEPMDTPQSRQGWMTATGWHWINTLEKRARGEFVPPPPPV
ncbi:MAG: hypothetical protein K8S98_12445 [Planctomycetes bacterium]|nr:hypothetical protein [Planctomycetota bacterium]